MSALEAQLGLIYACEGVVAKRTGGAINQLKRPSEPAHEAESTVARLEELIAAVCATSETRKLKKLHEQLSTLDILEASDSPKRMKRIKAVFARVDERLAELDPASDASFIVQCIRDTITSS